MNEVKGTARRKAFALVIVAILLVTIPLIVTGRQITTDTLTEPQTKRVAVEWAAATDFRVQQVQANGDTVYIAIIGNGDLPAFADLVTAVEASVGRPLDIILEMLPSQTMSNATGNQ